MIKGHIYSRCIFSLLARSWSPPDKIELKAHDDYEVSSPPAQSLVRVQIHEGARECKLAAEAKTQKCVCAAVSSMNEMTVRPSSPPASPPARERQDYEWQCGDEEFHNATRRRK